VGNQGGALTWRAYNENDEGKINKKWVRLGKMQIVSR
jgi:hypothetical protein